MNQEVTSKYYPSANSKMTRNKDGHWQYRENAALAAAGLNSSTVSHSCSNAGVRVCAFFGTLAGEGNTYQTDMIENSIDLKNKINEIIDNKKLPLHVKLFEYFTTISIRFNNNLEVCMKECGKQIFERNLD